MEFFYQISNSVSVFSPNLVELKSLLEMGILVFQKNNLEAHGLQKKCAILVFKEQVKCTCYSCFQSARVVRRIVL